MKILTFLIFLLISFLVNGNDLEGDQEIQEIVPFVGNGTASLQMQFMVSVRQSSFEITDRHFGNGHVCGGVILSLNHVLTAASCIEIRGSRIPTEEIFVIAGTRYRYIQDGSVRREARNVTIHPNYTSDPINNNLAIILVS